MSRTTLDETLDGLAFQLVRDSRTFDHGFVHVNLRASSAQKPSGSAWSACNRLPILDMDLIHDNRGRGILFINCQEVGDGIGGGCRHRGTSGADRHGSCEMQRLLIRMTNPAVTCVTGPCGTLPGGALARPLSLSAPPRPFYSVILSGAGRSAIADRPAESKKSTH